MVNSDKIDEGEETEDFDKDLRKLYCSEVLTTVFTREMKMTSSHEYL